MKPELDPQPYWTSVSALRCWNDFLDNGETEGLVIVQVDFQKMLILTLTLSNQTKLIMFQIHILATLDRILILKEVLREMWVFYVKWV